MYDKPYITGKRTPHYTAFFRTSANIIAMIY